MSKDVKLDSGQKAMIEVAKFKDSIKDKTEEQLLKIEQELIAEQDKHAKERNTKAFKMPSKNYKEAALAIRGSLNTMTVQWQYALALKTMYEFFDPEKKPAEIQFPMLDSTLRQLSNANLTGYDQWKNVVIVSDYFEPIREDYADTAAQVYVDAEKHNIVVNQLQLFKTKNEVQTGLEK